ncbi:MAG: 7-cyano-7-deazaguanine synthase QueC [Sulfurimonas sp. RIFCSPHIGHO2_12_FULL_36_9]|jgi:7-cyano-7-deazaguanine synthase|uniref:7-cyano-7-deazaguanine synthase QueC n=1 Tax=unclassified Sulfurimonas TaxID=2623549 RepID=UPI0008B8BF2F|nr:MULTISPECIES: 7-cyano-7-deazaguanine synthase QueC [unclassified Sulfurimonas]OHD97926.1 MAG: 7-cyano-7-deazaguanine synthase QueC [Sulfurimonas sp. RIFCSPHIGHO2_12_FULL_36_9]OHE00838.1 MAG: 7-cyano-7-deazaguanine synthase QueC [Sulfurimonas sp. RIFCSPLOWO2_02_FULL_36_28]OHE01836.1 MAG: 7-cyano-7-deazaguanine synthase QueC [Sulfurimonas sp. RIFCSPLOWO2_12_36_12]OHE07829.1 MAG: 7-cyano-7-deazaguanine synthase QueC [Sulfurimonas sp. RIFCSPLOWO2_12_FULL_36_74]
MILENKKAICIMSGGMDSTLSAYMMKKMGYEIVAVHFNYAQRTQIKELSCFHAVCDNLGVINRYVLDLDFFAQIGASALTDKSIEVPTGGLEEGVPVTYVPFRNGIFLSIAAAIAEKEGADAISIGVVEEDSSGYPDCREAYIKNMQKSINLGTKDETKIEIYMPLVHLNKSQIVKHALELNVPLQHTWSCYKDENKACGVCDSCRLRLNGFKLAGVKDPIEYQ